MTERSIANDTWTYSYTPDQNLERVTKNGDETDRYWYDAFGRRVKSLEGANGAITIYAGSEPIYVEGSPSATTHWFIYGPEGMLVAEKVGSQTFFCHQDGRGDVIQVTDSTAKTVWDADYKPYGEETTTVSTFAPSMKFVGEIKDNSTGLYGFGFRDYTTSTGRFTSEDPIRSSSSQYTYCGCDPVNNIDPQGLSKYIWRGLPTHAPTAEELAQATSVFIVGMAVLATIATAGIASPLLAAAVGAAIGAASGFASTYVVTQDVSASLQSALIGGILGAAAAGGGSIAGKMIGRYASSVVAGGTREEGAVGVGLRTLFKHDYIGVSGEINFGRLAGGSGWWASRGFEVSEETARTFNMVMESEYSVSSSMSTSLLRSAARFYWESGADWGVIARWIVETTLAERVFEEAARIFAVTHRNLLDIPY
jgi:RHS repeat-associated protein